MSDRKRYLNLTAAQTRVLCQIGAGFALPFADKRTFTALLERGLIVRTHDEIVGNDVFGPVTIPQYEMPVAEHIAWCKWCDENFEITNEVSE